MLSRVMDFVLSIPAILLAIVIIAVLGPSRISALAAVAIVGSTIREAIPGNRNNTPGTGVRPRVNSPGRRSLPAMGAHDSFRTRWADHRSMCNHGRDSDPSEAALSFLGLGRIRRRQAGVSCLARPKVIFRKHPGTGSFRGAAVTLTVLAFDAVARGLNRASRTGRCRPMARYAITRLLGSFPCFLSRRSLSGS